MERQKIMARIVGPLAMAFRSYEWEFVSRRKISHNTKSCQARRFTLRYDKKTRTFSATCIRRVSKRNKRERVTVSKGMTAYLKSRLPAAAIAKCLGASLTSGG